MKRQSDSGLTLVELLIVTVLLGLIATVISAAFVTILRVSPQNEFRIDDARATRGLQTWLVRDVASTPPRAASSGSTGFVIGTDGALSSANTCGASGTPVLHMTWAESGVLYHTNYRIDDGRVVRSTCGGDTSVIALTSSVSSGYCPSMPSDHAREVGGYKAIELCFLALETENGLNAGGGATSEIRLSVTSRSPVP